MDSKDRRKYLIFAGIVVLFLIFTAKRPYNNKTFQLSEQGAFVAKNTAEKTTEKQDRSFFSLSLPSFFSDDANRITNENCGISFKLKEGWIIEEVKESSRYCLYRIDNPERRGGNLEIGVPLTGRNEVYWDDVMTQLKNPTPDKHKKFDGADGYLFTFEPVIHEGGATYGDPMYIIRKDEAIYYVRYGYNPPEDNMMDDISSVLSSLRFPKERSFYLTPLNSVGN